MAPPKSRSSSRTASKGQSKSQSKSQSKPKPPPKPATILLIRHGQTGTTGKVLPGRDAKLALTDTGAAQAQATAAAVADRYQIAAIYSSPMKRARQTAQPLADLTRREVAIHPGLNECDFGSWTGRSLPSLMKLAAWRQVQQHPSGFRFPGGESFPDMQNRMVEALGELAQRHRGKTIAVYSHADTIKAALAHAMGIHLDLFQRLVISTAAVSVVQLGAGRPVILGVNQTYYTAT